MRLQQYLAACGLGSRRGCETLITDARVSVNGKIAVIGTAVDPSTDVIHLDGAPLVQESLVYILLHKPADTVCTVKDTHERRTVIDCLEGVDARVYPVGRLDLDVSGALILTNDGALAQRLAHPSFEVKKHYVARVEGRMTAAEASRLASGVELEDGMTAPATVRVEKRGPDYSIVHLTLHEGRKREVKRMCAAVDHPIIDLHRVSAGGLTLGALKPGQWRHLEAEEVQRLYDLVGLTKNP